MPNIFKVLFSKPSDPMITGTSGGGSLLGRFDTSGKRCFAGIGISFDYNYTDFKFACILERHEQFAFACNAIPSLTDWCIENKCIYGWARVICIPNECPIGDGISDFKLFIAAKDIEMCSLAKLTWL